ncbi:neuromedin-U receptor 2-like [Lytechinus variegatus]|uniref:neuromedin-U receptor 2-like n=1 Tax=Lytechinus variegatus TaxID=7654 RepID=UPI001BB0DB37|nr:neuromedin-U receptor 2-like [Lytechinus variegatus]
MMSLRNNTVDAMEGGDFEEIVNISNFTNDSLFDEGPRDSSKILWWHLVLLVLAFIGILGNTLVLMVLLRRKQKRSSTDTLIANLALADLAICLSAILVPIADSFKGIKTIPTGYCPFVDIPFTSLVATEASVLTLMGISIERFVAVLHPNAFERTFTPRRTLAIIGSIWVFSVVLDIYHFFIIGQENGECTTTFPSGVKGIILGIFIFSCRYFIPATVMVICQLRTIWELRTRKTLFIRPSRRRKSQRIRLVRVRRRVIATLFAVIVVFIICWTPDQLYFLFCSVYVISRSEIYSVTHRNLLLIGFTNSLFNIIIYAALNPKFRKALKNMFMDFVEGCHFRGCYSHHEYAVGQTRIPMQDRRPN